MCRPVHHIGDEGKHLEELGEGNSHHERDRDSIPAFCGGKSREKHQCRYQGTFQDKTHVCETPQEGERDSISAIHGGLNVLCIEKTTSVEGTTSKMSQGTLQRAPATG